MTCIECNKDLSKEIAHVDFFGCNWCNECYENNTKDKK